MTPLLSLFGMGGPEVVVIALVALLLFGARLPKVARALGQSVTEFKAGMKDPARRSADEPKGEKD